MVDRAVDFLEEQGARPLAWWNQEQETQLEQLDRFIKKTGCDCVDLTLSYGAWQRDPFAFRNDLTACIQLCQTRRVRMIVTLFRRVRRGHGGGELTLGRILPDTAWEYKRGFYQPYFRDVVRGNETNADILLWEICDCVVLHGGDPEQLALIQSSEPLLRKTMFHTLKSAGVTQPAGFSVQSGDEDAVRAETEQMGAVLIRREGSALCL